MSNAQAKGQALLQRVQDALGVPKEQEPFGALSNAGAMATDFYTDPKDIKDGATKTLLCTNTLLFHVRRFHNEIQVEIEDPDNKEKTKTITKIETFFKISTHKDVQSIVDFLQAEREKKERDALEAKKRLEEAQRKAEEEAKRTGQPVQPPVLEQPRGKEKGKIIDEYGGGIYYVFKVSDAKDLLTGYVDSKYLDCIHILSERIYQNALGVHGWGKITSEVQVGAFMSQIKNFIDNLAKYQLIVKDQLVLAIPNDPILTKIPKETLAINKMLSEQPEAVSTIEQAVAALCNQIEAFLVDQEKVRVEGDTAGPESEIIHWSARMACFNHVQSQLNIEWIKDAYNLLNAGNSSVVQRWIRVKQRIQEGTNEAKDNLKYLNTIQEILQPLYSNSPGKMTLVLRELIDTIATIHQMAKYYGSDEHMTTLMIKISNQMIKACRTHIREMPKIEGQPKQEGPVNPDEKKVNIFDREFNDIVKRIQVSVGLYETYIMVYQSKNTELGDAAFAFSQQAIFGNFEIFCNRLKKVFTIITTNNNFAALNDCTLPGLEKIIQQQQSLVNLLKVKIEDPLEHRKPAFDTEYDNYMAGIQSLEKNLASYLDSMFNNPASHLNDLISTMQQLNVVLNRPNMRQLIFEKYDLLILKYQDYHAQIRKIFDNRHKNIERPDGFTTFAGNIGWCQMLIHRLNQPAQFLRLIYVKTDEDLINQGVANNMSNNMSMLDIGSIKSMEKDLQANSYVSLFKKPKGPNKRIHLDYKKTMSEMEKYIKEQFDLWVDSIQSIRMSMQSTVLVQQPKSEELFVNFDPKIQTLCREVRLLEILKVEKFVGKQIPDAAKSIYLHEESIIAYRDRLTELCQSIKQCQNDIHPDCRPLMKPLVVKLVKRIQPLLKQVCWSSINLPERIDLIQQQISLIQDTNRIVNDIMTIRVGKNLKDIASACLLPLAKRHPFDSEFDVSHGGTAVDQHILMKSSPADDNAENAAFTNHQMRLFSTYVQQNNAALTIRKYMDSVQPHITEIVRTIYQKSQFIAAAAAEVVTLISSRFVDSPNQDLKLVVMSAIMQCFDPDYTIVQNKLQENGIVPTQQAEIPKASVIISDTIRCFVNTMHTRMQQALFNATDRTLRALMQRIGNIDPYKNPTGRTLQNYDPATLLEADFQLINQNLKILPDVPTIENALNKIVKFVLDISKQIPTWNSRGEYYNTVLQSLSPIITEIYDETKTDEKEKLMSSLVQNLTYTTQTVQNAQTRNDQIQLWVSAQDRWEKGAFNKVITSKILQQAEQNFERLKDLEVLGIENTVYQHIGNSKQMLKITMSLKYFFSNMVKAVEKQLVNYEQFKKVWSEDKVIGLKKFLDERPQLPDFTAKFVQFDAMIKNISLIPDCIEQGILHINTSDLKNTLSVEMQALKDLYTSKLSSEKGAELVVLSNYLNDIEQQLDIVIDDNLENVRKVMKAINNLKDLESDFDNKLRPIQDAFNTLNKFGFKVPAEESELVEQLSYKLKNVNKKSNEDMNILISLQSSLKNKLESEIAVFKEEAATFTDNWYQRGPQELGIAPQEASRRLREMQNTFIDIERKWMTYNTGEELFGVEITHFDSLVKIKKDIRFLNQLYSLYNDVINTIDGYSDQLWKDLNFDDIAILINTYAEKCAKLPKQMKDWDAYKELDKKISDFQLIQPLFQKMQGDAILPRHWDQMYEITKEPSILKAKQVGDDPIIAKLSDITKADLVKYCEDIEDICGAAEKEADIDAKFKDIKNTWKDQNFFFDEFKTRGKVILKAADTTNLRQTLEDSQMKLSSLYSNRFNKPFKDEIKQWVGFLSNMDERLTLWLQVQQNWIYLEAVFSSGDIARQLPQEAKNFSQIDKDWVRIMTTANQNPNCIDITSRDDTLKTLLPHLIVQLEYCQKQLAGYLETKRNLFPRFYFCSDPILLEILGQQSDPNSIQQHLLSIFDSINRLHFGQGSGKNQILKMEDKLKEIVDMTSIVTAKDSVEDWLNRLVEAMQKTMKDIIRSAASELSRPDIVVAFKEMFDAWPAQVSLLCIQILWTMWCEKGFKNVKADRKALNRAVEDNKKLMNQLIDITVKPTLDKKQRTNIETLITIQVHNNDVLEQLKSTVKSDQDFDWKKQTRFYWDVEVDTCKIQITDINFIYAYEYLGVNERLVITPLTDRCYITLAQAIGLYLGGAPAGPAGTGKTETVKDLGKSLGSYVVVFNCSDQMDYKGLGKIYRGIAQTGCFGDFDEFNRIELAVMSVSAQQISCILSAIKDNKKQFLYTDGCVISLITSAAYFITMNPGYAGRQELLENLKALFRSVAMISLFKAHMCQVCCSSV